METIKTSSNVEFDVIYADGTRKRVPEGILYEAESSGDVIFHNGTDRPEVLLAAAETALVSSHRLGHGLEILVLGMALGNESRAALERLAKFTNSLLDLHSGEQKGCFRLGQLDMKESVILMLQDTASHLTDGVVRGAVLMVIDLVKDMEVP